MKGFKSIEYHDVQKDLMDYWEKGAQPGVNVGYDNISEFYTVKLGSCTDLTGYPHSGKSLVLMDWLMNLSMLHNWKHLIWMPDEGSTVEILSSLIHAYTGMTFDKRYSNYIDEKSVYNALPWILDRFQIMEKIDNHKPTPYEFWEYAATTDCHTAVIDSWNFMNHHSDMSDTKYLADVLTFRNKLAEKCMKHFFTIIHPKSPTAKDFDSEGKLRPPRPENMMGGSEWNNNGKTILSVHRESKQSLEYDIYFWKVKPRVVGHAGQTTLQFDAAKKRFFEMKMMGETPVRKFAFGNRVESEEKLNSLLDHKSEDFW